MSNLSSFNGVSGVAISHADAGQISGDLLSQADDGLVYYVLSVGDVGKLSSQFLLGLCLEHLLVYFEHFDAGVFPLLLEGVQVLPQNEPCFVFFLNPVFVRFGGGREVFLQLLFVRGPVCFELGFCLGDILVDGVGLDPA